MFYHRIQRECEKLSIFVNSVYSVVAPAKVEIVAEKFYITLSESVRLSRLLQLFEAMTQNKEDLVLRPLIRMVLT